MTEEELQELEALAVRWRTIVGDEPTVPWEDHLYGNWYVYAPSRCTILEAGLDNDVEDRALCEIVVGCVEAVPALIAEVRRLKYEREGFTMEVSNLRTELDNYRQAYADSVAEVRRLRGEVGGFISREDALAIALDTMSEPDGKGKDRGAQ